MSTITDVKPQNTSPVRVWTHNIRRAGTYDILLIGALAKRIWQAHYTAILSDEQIDYMLKLMYAPENLYRQMEEGHEFWIIEADDMPVGYASVSNDEDRQYHLHKLYVDTELQRYGLGSRMMEHLIQLYRPSSMRLGVNRNNYRAVNFYFRNGFVIEGTQNTDIGNGFIMEDFAMTRQFY